MSEMKVWYEIEKYSLGKVRTYDVIKETEAFITHVLIDTYRARKIERRASKAGKFPTLEEAWAHEESLARSNVESAKRRLSEAQEQQQVAQKELARAKRQ